MPLHVPPKLGLSAFSCAHCHALAHQDWYYAYAKNGEDNWIPSFWTEAEIENQIKNEELSPELADLLRAMAMYYPFRSEDGVHIYANWMPNMVFSQCFSCKKSSVWINDKLLIPHEKFSIEANEDLPHHIRADFEEAASIVRLSPRGAAALLRLCIQKICVVLEQPGKNLNSDIANLVKLGLSRKVQQALDLVRVVGNDAVHPGIIDLRDDEATARQLFVLVNIIASSMISQPAQVEKMYNDLPGEKLAQIEKRDRPKAD